MSLADRMRADLKARGVFAGKPADRDAVVKCAAELVPEADWSLAVAYVDEFAAGNRRVAAVMLFDALDSVEAWEDLVDCAKAAQNAPKADTAPSHYNASPPPTGDCIHGIPGSSWCEECAARPHASSSAPRDTKAIHRAKAAARAAEAKLDALERNSGSAYVRVLVWLAIAAVSLGGLYGAAGVAGVGLGVAFLVGCVGAGAAAVDERQSRVRAQRDREVDEHLVPTAEAIERRVLLEQARSRHVRRYGP